jgi:hypothetical protein
VWSIANRKHRRSGESGVRLGEGAVEAGRQLVQSGYDTLKAVV